MLTITEINHRGEDRLGIQFPFDNEIIEKVKTIPDARWSATLKLWHVPNNKISLQRIAEIFPGFGGLGESFSIGKKESDSTDKMESLPAEKKENHSTEKREKEIRIIKGGNKIKVIMPYNQKDIRLLQSIRNSFFCKEWKYWILPDRDNNLEILKAYFGERAEVREIREEKKATKASLRRVELPELTNAENIEFLKKFEEWINHRRYSLSTRSSYIKAMSVFMRFLGEKSILEANNDDMVDFVNSFLLANSYSHSYQNQVINAIKLFFKEVTDMKMQIAKLERPVSQFKLPHILNKDEIKKILDAVKNPKHKAMLILTYGCGLRRSEVLNLEPADINSTREILIVRNAKGFKDRVVPITPSIIELLREYFKAYKPVKYLFEGAVPGIRYSETSFQTFFKDAVRKAGVTEHASLHWLRHSYATHLMDKGTDLRIIQEVLGHKSSKTTEIYTHVSNMSLKSVGSPFDDL